MDLDQILVLWAAGMVPKGAHRDFLPVPGPNPSRSCTWSRKWPCILIPGNMETNFQLGEPYLDELPTFLRICPAQKVRMDREMISGFR